MRFGIKREGAGCNTKSKSERGPGTITDAEKGGKMPLDFLLAIMRDEDVPMATRVKVAIIALPYCHAKLAPKQQSDTPWMTQEEAVAMFEMEARIEREAMAN
jgi:hypothetical protein